MYLIVGIDPGTTTAIATLNFEGELIDLHSSKNIGLKGAIQHIIKKGKVSLIATDVSPCPEFVANVATKLGAEIFTPKESLYVQDKNLITKNHGVKDNHQRDALAAALTAFHDAQKKFSATNMELDDEMKHLLLQGVNIKKVNETREKNPQSVRSSPAGDENEEEQEKHGKKTEKKISEQKTKITDKKELKELERRNSYLKEKIAENEKEIARLNILLKKIKNNYSLESKKEEEIAKRERTIRNLENLLNDLNTKLSEFEKLREVWLKVARNEIFPVTVFPEISKFVVIKKRIKEADTEKLKGVKIAFTEDERNVKYLSEKGFLVRTPENVNEVCGFHYIEKRDLELTKTKIKEKRFSLDEIVESYRKERA